MCATVLLRTPIEYAVRPLVFMLLSLPFQVTSQPTISSLSQASCNPSYCLNGGTCVTIGDGSRIACLCMTPYRGDRCELSDSSELVPFNCMSLFHITGRSIDYCASQPCLNQGVCTLGPFTYDCKCVRPFSGKRCESVSSTNCKLTISLTSTFCLHD